VNVRNKIGQIVALGLVVLSSCPAVLADSTKTIVRDQKSKQKLLGKHKLALQWISWDKFGSANVVDVGGQLLLKGEQLGADKGKASTSSHPGAPGNIGDYLKIDGVITEIDAKQFKFKGKILMKVSSIAGGKECKRDGTFTFALKSHPTYWRMQEMQNPCDEVVDYVDVFCR